MVDRHIALYARVSTEQQARDATVASQVAALRERIAADGGCSSPTARYRRRGLQRLEPAAPGPGAAARRRGRRRHRAALRPRARPAGPALRPPGAADRGVPARGRRGRVPQPPDRRHRRGRSPAADAGRDRRVRARQDPRAGPPRSPPRGPLRLGQRVCTTAPFGYRYVTKDQGGGVARFEVVPDEARVVRQIFAWVGLERLSLREACRRLERAGCPTRRGSARWYATTVRGMLANTAYVGRAVFGHSRFLPARPRLRPIRGHPRPSSAPTARVAVPGRSGSRCRCRRWSTRPCSRPPRRSSARTGGASGTGGAAPAGCCRA